MTKKKIVSLNDLKAESEKLKADGVNVVLCHGTFDLMHAGHIRYLQRAKQEGDVLFVTVTGDEFVNKGPGRPVFNENLRADNLAALECVDFVAVNYAVSAVELLRSIQPAVYAKGSEYQLSADDVTGNIVLEKDAVEESGGRIFFTDEITFSSSSLLNEHFNIFSPDVRPYLEQFRKTWSDQDVHDAVDTLRSLKVLVIGDSIVDQYHYVTPLGQTGKGNSLAVRYESDEQFAGGAIAVANHIAGFADSVTLLSGLGSTDSHESFIREKLKDNVTPVFHYFKDAPTVTKRRFVDDDLNKLFEIYFSQDVPILEQGVESIINWLEENVNAFDAVVVADFGNGFIQDSMIQPICSKSKHLSVNTQINSGNRGYHVISRYSSADFVSVNEPELRMAAHNRYAPLEDVGKKVALKLGAHRLAVTRGTKGMIMYDKTNDAVHTVPALSTKVIDRIGAGDAFLSIAALCNAKKLDVAMSAFLGSVAAAMDVQIVCNRESIDPILLKKYVTTLLK